MKPEAPTANVRVLVRVSRRLKAGLLDNEGAEVLAPSVISVGVEPSTNEAPH